jgi:hypothetical protein
MHERAPGCKRLEPSGSVSSNELRWIGVCHLRPLPLGRPALARGPPARTCGKPIPGLPGSGATLSGQRRQRRLTHCGFTNRPTRPAEPLAWFSSFA